MSRSRCVILVAAVCAVVCGSLRAEAPGRIEGRVVQADGMGIGGVTVAVEGLQIAAVTAHDGAFRLAAVPPGAHDLTFALGERVERERRVEVRAGQVTALEKSVDWVFSFADTITVVSASRRPERMVEAPSAVTQVGEAEIARQAAHGQLPKLLEFTPGVEPTQSGVYDFNLNTRGFNGATNRRVSVLVDGRDPSVPFLGATEWSIVSHFLYDLESAELVRGPSSALYGKNAFNGVLNLVTRAPRHSRGGLMRVTGGELATTSADVRWAGEIGSDWFARVNGSYLKSDDFSLDRVVSVEYPGLAPEVAPRVVDTYETSFGNLRLDRYRAGGDFWTLETGLADSQAPAIQSYIGRFSLPSMKRWWARARYNSPRWNAQAYFNDRDGGEQTNLQSGLLSYDQSRNFQLEAQGNWTLADGRLLVVAGASHREEEIDTADANGRQTLFFDVVDSDSQAVYGQGDVELSGRVKLVLAARYDASTLHDSRLSPRAALVVSLDPRHTLRLGYHEGFQVANYAELFLYAPLGAFPGAMADALVCGTQGLSCGLDPVIPVIASGNNALEVEEIRSLELGYRGILGDKVLLTVDAYSGDLENFITGFLPQLGTSLGTVNAQLVPYSAPGIPPLLLQGLHAAIAQLTGGGQLTYGPDGSQIITAVSVANFGQVDTRGADLGLNVRLTPEWRLDLAYSWLDFEIGAELPETPLVPNAPENHGSVGLSWVGETFDAAVHVRWVESFDWWVGSLYRGRVPAYETADLVLNYRLDDNWSLGLNVANVLDDEHWETFGGDVLGRRALGSLAFKW